MEPLSTTASQLRLSKSGCEARSRWFPQKLFTVKVLFQRLEKQLDLPALFIDGGNGGGFEIEQIGEQHDLALVLRIPNYNTAQRSGAVGLCLNAAELDDLVGEDIGGFCGTSNLALDRKGGTLSFRRVTKKIFILGPASKPGISRYSRDLWPRWTQG